MNSMGKSWVMLGAFKLKEWYINGDIDQCAKLYHKGCINHWDVDSLFLPEILDIIAEHECNE